MPSSSLEDSSRASTRTRFLSDKTHQDTSHGFVVSPLAAPLFADMYSSTAGPGTRKDLKVNRQGFCELVAISKGKKKLSSEEVASNDAATIPEQPCTAGSTLIAEWTPPECCVPHCSCVSRGSNDASIHAALAQEKGRLDHGTDKQFKGEDFVQIQPPPRKRGFLHGCCEALFESSTWTRCVVVEVGALKVKADAAAEVEQFKTCSQLG